MGVALCTLATLAPKKKTYTGRILICNVNWPSWNNKNAGWTYFKLGVTIPILMACVNKWKSCTS